MLAKVSIGLTTHNEDQLKELIKSVVDPEKKYAMVDEVDFASTVKVIVSDLEQLRARSITLNGKSLADIVNIVCSSCALPFIFRNHNTKDYKSFVDGGLIQNLPVQEVLDENTSPLYVMAIGFDDIAEDASEKLHAKEKPFFRYAKSTVAAAIASNVSSSKSLVPAKNTLVIPSHFGLLDFSGSAKALAKYDARFTNIRRLADDFILSVTDRNKQIETHRILRERSSVPASFTSLKMALTAMVKSRMPRSLKKIGFTYAELNSLRQPGDPRFSLYDSYFHEFYYEVPEDGLSCIVLGVSNYDTPEEANTLQSFLVSGDNGSLAHDVLPIDDLSEKAPSEELAYVAILLRETIFPADTTHIRIVQKENIKGGFPHLQKKGFDVIDYTPEHGIEYESLTLAFGIPEDLRDRFLIEPLREQYDKDSQGLNFITGTERQTFEEIDDIVSPNTAVVAFKSDRAFAEGSAFVLGITDKWYEPEKD